jgi:hypothetical protein
MYTEIKPSNSSSSSVEQIFSTRLKQIWFMTNGKIGDGFIILRFKCLCNIIFVLISYILKK